MIQSGPLIGSNVTRVRSTPLGLGVSRTLGIGDRLASFVGRARDDDLETIRNAVIR
jgi:hypothetical protein